MKNLFSIFAMSIISFSIYAQNFMPGTIVMLNNDTISGFIKNRDMSVRSQTCVFKKTEPGELIEYKVDQLKSIHIHGGAYYIAGESIGYVKNIFLRYLVKGKISLFAYKQDNIEHFVASKDGVIVELYNKIDTVRNGNTTFVRSSNRYKSQLRVLMATPSLNKQLERTTYKSTSLIAVIKKYNELASSGDEKNIVYLKREKPLHARVGVFAQAGSPKLNLSRSLLSQYYGVGRWNFSSNESTVGGLLLNIGLKRYRRFSLQLEPGYQKTSYHSNITYSDYALVFNDIQFDLDAINIPLSLKIYITDPKMRLAPFVQGGLYRAYFLNTTSSITYRVTQPNGEEKAGAYNNFEFGSRQSGVFFTAGAKCKIFGGEIFAAAKYDKGKGIHSNSENPSAAYKKLSSTSALSIQVGYIF